MMLPHSNQPWPNSLVYYQLNNTLGFLDISLFLKPLFFIVWNSFTILSLIFVIMLNSTNLNLIYLHYFSEPKKITYYLMSYTPAFDLKLLQPLVYINGVMKCYIIIITVARQLHVFALIGDKSLISITLFYHQQMCIRDRTKTVCDIHYISTQ